MVVLVPFLPGEAVRRCTRCSHVGIASPVRERSSFYSRGGARRGEFQAHCRRCSTAKARAWQKAHPDRHHGGQRAWRQATLADPEKAERYRETQRRGRRAYDERARAKRLSDPDEAERYLAMRRESDRRTKSRRRRDPNYVREERENWRFDYRRQKERSGDVLQVEENRTSNVPVMHPVDEFRAWLEDLITIEERECDPGALMGTPESRVSARLNVLPRRLYHYRKGGITHISESVIDRCLSRDGTWHLDEFLRFGNPLAGAPQTVQRAEPRVRRCGDPNCDEVVTEGRFCEQHRKALARVREELEGEAAALRSRIKRRGARPLCCRPGCTNPRVPPDAFCDSCQDEGFVEEEE